MDFQQQFLQFLVLHYPSEIITLIFSNNNSNNLLHRKHFILLSELKTAGHDFSGYFNE